MRPARRLTEGSGTASAKVVVTVRLSHSTEPPEPSRAALDQLPAVWVEPEADLINSEIEDCSDTVGIGVCDDAGMEDGAPGDVSIGVGKIFHADDGGGSKRGGGEES